MGAGGNFGAYGPEEPVYEEIMSNRGMSDAEDFCDEMQHRNIRRRMTANDCDVHDEDDDDVDDPCLNDNDDLIHQNYRLRPGADGTNDISQQHLHNRCVKFHDSLAHLNLKI